MTDSIDRMYAYIATDPEGSGEGIAAHFMPGQGWMPLVGADMERMNSLRPIAQKLADAGGRRIVLAHFEDRRDIEVLEPGSPSGNVTIINPTKPKEADQ